MDEPRISNELIFDILKAIQDRLGRIETRLERLEDRMGHIESLMGDMIKNDLSRNAEMTALERRIARIERRLELSNGGEG